MSVHHNYCQHPQDKNVKIWRYMDFAKFISLLQTKTLFFSRADKFTDNFEGSTPKIVHEFLKKHLPPHALEGFSNLIKGIGVNQMFVNCWHMNEYESNAMWSLYSTATGSICIQSTFQKLFDSLPNDVQIGMVNYIDYEKDSFSLENLFLRILHKRNSFDHEKELRALVWEPSIKSDIKEKITQSGLSIDIDLVSLIDKVYLNPSSPSWFYDVVKKEMLMHGLTIDVVKSSLSMSPRF